MERTAAIAEKQRAKPRNESHEPMTPTRSLEISTGASAVSSSNVISPSFIIRINKSPSDSSRHPKHDGRNRDITGNKYQVKSEQCSYEHDGTVNMVKCTCSESCDHGDCVMKRNVKVEGAESDVMPSFSGTTSEKSSFTQMSKQEMKSTAEQNIAVYKNKASSVEFSDEEKCNIQSIILVDDADMAEVKPGNVIDLAVKKITFAYDSPTRSVDPAGGGIDEGVKRVLDSSDLPAVKRRSFKQGGEQTKVQLGDNIVVNKIKDCVKDRARSSDFTVNTLRESSLLACEVCHSRFIESEHLRKHMLTHTTCMLCHGCGKVCTSDMQLKKHISLAHHCRFCKEFFADLKKMRIHVNSHKRSHSPVNKTPRATTNRNPAGRTLPNRKKPLIDIKVPSYKCARCRTGFNSFQELRTHQMNHGDQEVYNCSKCSKTFNSLDNLEYHMTTHEVTNLLVDKEGSPIPVVATTTANNLT